MQQALQRFMSLCVAVCVFWSMVWCGMIVFSAPKTIMVFGWALPAFGFCVAAAVGSIVVGTLGLYIYTRFQEAQYDEKDDEIVNTILPEGGIEVTAVDSHGRRQRYHVDMSSSSSPSADERDRTVTWTDKKNTDRGC